MNPSQRALAGLISDIGHIPAVRFHMTPHPGSEAGRQQQSGTNAYTAAHTPAWQSIPVWWLSHRLCPFGVAVANSVS